MWENINCGDFINCGRLSSLLWVALNAIFGKRPGFSGFFLPLPLTNDIDGVDVVDIIDIIDVVDVVDEACEII